jgi:hypothetical protein
MSVKWTLLACVAVLALALGVVVAFESAHARTSAQREAFANRLWPVVGVAIVGLWGWNLAGRRSRR